MPSYRRAHQPGGAFFFTIVTDGRAPLFEDAANRMLLHEAVAAAGRDRPFNLDGMVLLPDHCHLQMTLPADDADFSTRLAAIKARFTRLYLSAGGTEQPRSASRVAKRRRGVWQRWFWEHHIRDDHDRSLHLDYIHYNAVKHGLAKCPHAYPYSSFARHVGLKHYDVDWCCSCVGRILQPPPSFDDLPVHQMEFGE